MKLAKLVEAKTALTGGKNITAHYLINVIKERCKGCRLCIEFCPKHVLHETAECNRRGYHPVGVNGNNGCLNCGLCQLLCPEFAIYVVPLETVEV